MKIATVLGARPQLIKAAVVSRELSRRHDVQEILVHTGQHYDENMKQIFFDQMDISYPDYCLEISNLPHGAMTGQMLEQIEKIIIEQKPDCVVVYGDTNSTLAGALAAKKQHVPVAHVEAGLRSFNMRMPEEINRILTDRISDLLLCPTPEAVKNLKREGFGKFNSKVVLSGDVMQDAALYYSNKEKKPEILNNFDFSNKFALATIHREENTDNPAILNDIVRALNKINTEIPVIIPLHPRTQKKLNEFNLKLETKTLTPVGYLEMIYLLKRAEIVLTDSGGLQKEAFFFKRPCVTIREETEWVELVDNGFNGIAGINYQNIYTTYCNMLNREIEDKKNLYGGGKSAILIVEEILNCANLQKIQ